jgi:carboxymethylenebutenolidase
MGEVIAFESNGGTAEGYLARPESGKGPGVVVVQEWWGLNDQIKGVADRFASEGFTSLAPDFYRGKATTEPDEAGKLLMALNSDQVAKDGRGAAKYLAKETGGKVGVIGFCMGGQLALLVGTAAPDEVAAVVDMYGIHPAIKPDFTKMKASVLALFGGADHANPPEAREALAKELEAAGVPFMIDVYPKPGHAFMNETGDGYDPGAAEDAWRRILEFFREKLDT